MTPELSSATDTARLPTLDFYLAAISLLLRRLDALLLASFAATQAARELDADPLRGLYIAQEEVTRLLAPEPPSAVARRDPLAVRWTE
jgi:hypothetical protein